MSKIGRIKKPDLFKLMVWLGCLHWNHKHEYKCIINTITKDCKLVCYQPSFWSGQSQQIICQMWLPFIWPDSSSNIGNGIESFDKYKAQTPQMKRKHQKLFIDWRSEIKFSGKKQQLVEWKRKTILAMVELKVYIIWQVL